ncbi:MAG: ABC transporter permease [Thermomicrobiales bacterium]
MASSLFWKPLPVATLTVRQFLGGKAVRVVALLAFLPFVFGLIYLLNTEVATQREFLAEVIFSEMVAPTLLPITVLILATAALGNEIEDRTLPYLALKPLSRARIVIEKLLGILVVAGPIVLAGLAATYAVVMRGDAGEQVEVLTAMLAAAAVGTLAYSAVFLFVSLIIPRALLMGIIYTFVWESLLGRFLPGLRVVSVRHAVDSIFVGMLDDPAVTTRNATAPMTATLVVVAVAVVCVVLATWRLQRMNLD